MSYDSKDSLVQNRKLKVQRLVIPFTITSSATPSAVLLRCDEPNIMFMQSQGVDQITAGGGDTADFSDPTPTDASGELNIYLKVGEIVEKFMRASAVSRVTGVQQPVKMGDADGLDSEGNMLLTMDSTVNHATTNFDGCLEVEYVISEDE